MGNYILNDRQIKFLEWCIFNKHCTYIDSGYIERELRLAQCHEFLINTVLSEGVYNEDERKELKRVVEYFKDKYESRNGKVNSRTN